MEQAFIALCINCDEMDTNDLSIFYNLNGKVCPVCGNDEFVLFDYTINDFVKDKSKSK